MWAYFVDGVWRETSDFQLSTHLPCAHQLLWVMLQLPEARLDATAAAFWMSQPGTSVFELLQSGPWQNVTQSAAVSYQTFARIRGRELLQMVHSPLCIYVYIVPCQLIRHLSPIQNNGCRFWDSGFNQNLKDLGQIMTH